MLFGNPSDFAIAWEIVKPWCNKTFIEGLLKIYIGSFLLGKKDAISVTLSTEIFFMWKDMENFKAVDPFPSFCVGRNSEEIYHLLQEYTYPQEESNAPHGSEYEASPCSILDEGGHMYRIQSEKFDQIYYGEWGKFKGVFYLPKNEYERVVTEAWLAFEKQAFLINP